MYSFSVMSDCEDQHGSFFFFSKERFFSFDSADTHVNDGGGKDGRVEGASNGGRVTALKISRETGTCRVFATTW